MHYPNELKIKLRYSFSKGFTLSEIARNFDLTRSEVRNIVRTDRIGVPLPENWICIFKDCPEGYINHYSENCPGCGRSLENTWQELKRRQAKRSLLKTSANNVIAE